MDTKPDAELYGLALAGDRDAVRAIAERYHGDLVKHARAKTNSRATADDAVANAWLRFFQHLKHAAAEPERAIDKPESLRFWLLTAVRHSLLDIYRSTARADELIERVSEEEVAHGRLAYQPDFLERLTDGERRQTMLRAFAQLSEVCRELLSLLLLDPPMEYAAVAETLGRPVGSIGPMRQRCIDSLRSLVLA
jgi:RNA polymerase sigma factor (sigma-70 family)